MGVCTLSVPSTVVLCEVLVPICNLLILDAISSLPLALVAASSMVNELVPM